MPKQYKKELVKLGLDDRGTHIKNTVHDRYSDGSLQDWYGIIRESKLRGVPAIIVEHAFLSNSSDYSNFLNSNSKLQKLGMADATGIAKAFGLSKKTGIEIDTSSYKGMVGDVYQFLVGVYGISGTPKVYSTNTEVVSVKLKDANDFRGRLYELKCLKSGTADIVVELGKYKKSFPVEITAMDYSLDTKSYTMEVGGSYQFLALIPNKTGKEAPKVKSSNEKVVKVKLVSSNDKRGYLYEINGVGAGSATISVDYYGVVKTLNVTVKKKNITLSLDTKKYEGKVGDKYQFLAYTNNRNAISKATSSDPSVASIRLVNKNDSRGVLYEIKGLKAGTTTIQVQAGDKTAKFNATYKAMDYSLDTKSYTMEVGGSYQFLALIPNKTGKEAPKVKSSNEKVVKVKLVSSNDKRGYLYEINGVGAGSATISVDYYGVVKTLNVTVKKKNITLSLDTKKYEGKVGDKYQFLAYTNNRNAISKATSSDPSVASIRLVNKNDSRGVLYEIKGLKAGTTTIQVQAGDKTAKFNATYKAMDYSLDTKSYTMEVGGSYQFLALIPNKTGKEAPKVKSSNEKVVKVKLVSSNDKRGYLYEINGVGAGSATISVDYYGVVKTLNVTVKKKNITLSLDTKKYEGKVGDKYQFLAYTNNRNAISKATSSDPSVASIRLVNKNDSRGVLYEIKGLKAGTTTIQVQAGDKTAKFNATYKAMDYSLDTKSYTMEVGGSYQFLALIPNKTGKEAPKVKSSNEKVVKVKLVSSNDKRGYLYEINGVGAGSATISVDYYGVIKTLNVTVKKLYEIMGDTVVTVDELMALYSSKGKTYPKYYKDTEAPNLKQFCQIYIEESAEEGVKAEVAFCQAMLETGWLQFGGDVKIRQYNFAGIGATGGGAAGASFSDVRTGIRAQVQHLKAYASTSALKNECVDPRFKYVKRGSAKYVEWLGQKENPNGNGWATGKNYGYNILKLINEI